MPQVKKQIGVVCWVCANQGFYQGKGEREDDAFKSCKISNLFHRISGIQSAEPQNDSVDS